MGLILWIITHKLQEANGERSKALADARIVATATICENQLNETRMKFEAVNKVYEQQMRYPNMVPDNLLSELKTTRDGWAIDLAILEGYWASLQNTRPVKNKQLQEQIFDWIQENIVPEAQEIATDNYTLPH